jgi:hypothetical protein
MAPFDHGAPQAVPARDHVLCCDGGPRPISMVRLFTIVLLSGGAHLVKLRRFD